MTTAQAVQTQVESKATYEQLLQKGMAVACFLFPLLFLVSAVFFLTSTREFNAEAGQWIGSNDVSQFRFVT